MTKGAGLRPGAKVREFPPNPIADDFVTREPPMNDIARQTVLGATLLALTAGTAGAHDRYYALSFERQGVAPYYNNAYGLAWGFGSPQDAIEAAYKACREAADNPHDCQYEDMISANLHGECIVLVDGRPLYGRTHYDVYWTYNDGGAEARQNKYLERVECHEEHAEVQ